jgi:glycosyltransferase involved in cell wall biosynthesis
MPEIQIFIATYNRPTLVVNAINSVLNQDFDSFEVIVSDNSSNDETENLISRLKNKRF